MIENYRYLSKPELGPYRGTRDVPRNPPFIARATEHIVAGDSESVREQEIEERAPALFARQDT
jgi:hypothetical protein